jgi:hypothetical protein
LEERDAPPQVIFGAMDPHYDTLSLLGLWLEYRFEYHYHPEENEFIFCVDGDDDPIRIKEQLRTILAGIIGREDFVIRDLGKLGTHSTRKLAVTFSRGNGCSRVRSNSILMVLLCRIPTSFL